MMKICASISGTEPKEFSKSAARALNMGASFLEIRFDYIAASSFSEALAVVRPYKAKCIYTLRRTSQGGKFDGSEIQRLTYLKELASQLPMMIDVGIGKAASAYWIGSADQFYSKQGYR